MESLTGSNDSTEFQVLSEIVKKLLCRALECEGYNENAIARVTLSYLASLHFATSEYKISIDLSSRVILNEKFEIEETETLNAGCLLYNEDIAIIIGFYFIFRKATNASLQYTRRQIFLDLRITPKVFAQH